jgi:hypothetical protein
LPGAFHAIKVVREALQLACSLRWAQTTLPVEIIVAGFDDFYVDLLRAHFDKAREGTRRLLSTRAILLVLTLMTHPKVHDVSPRIDELKRAYHPRDGPGIKPRNDGWATFAKFYLWEHTEYDRIVFFDGAVEGCILLPSPRVC